MDTDFDRASRRFRNFLFYSLIALNPIILAKVGYVTFNHKDWLEAKYPKLFKNTPKDIKDNEALLVPEL